jgi:predicted aspartyl protease
MLNRAPLAMLVGQAGLAAALLLASLLPAGAAAPRARHLAPAGMASAGAAAGVERAPDPPPIWRTTDTITWPEGTEVLEAENLEGITLLKGTLFAPNGLDTTGLYALDTGAGYLAVDLELARRLGLADSAVSVNGVGLASHPIPRFTLGKLEMTDVEPVLTVDGDVMRRVTDRPIVGLLGQKPVSDRAVWIDYREAVVALIPIAAVEPATSHSRHTADEARSRAALRDVLSTQAVAVPFQLAGDGKVLVAARVSNPRPPRFSPWLTLIVDTGASKTVFFEDELAANARHAGGWPTLGGLSAPTLVGTATARLARVPEIEVRTETGGLSVSSTDVALIRSDLSGLLSRVTQVEIHGLLGYSWLKHFRVVFDYPDRILWLDPIPGYVDDRPLEYSHVGLQIERREGQVVIAGVASGSPAARAGIKRGDVLVAVDGDAAADLDLVALARRLEGPPGTPTRVEIRRGDHIRTYRLVRRKLL